MRPIASRPQTSLTFRAAALAALLLTGPAVADTTTAPAAPTPPTATPGQPQIAELYAGDVRSLVVHPDQPDLVLAGTSGGQVYRSTDGGVHWTNAGAVLPFQGWVVGTLMWDPDRKDRIWAGLWGLWGGGRVVYSEDLGATWRSRAKGLPDGPIYALAAVPGRPGHLYAASLSGVYSTVDDGLSWQHATRDFPEVHNVSSLLVDPFDGNTVIAGTWRRAFRSTDGGKSWHGVFEGMLLDSEVFSLQPVAGRPGEVWASTCGWVYNTTNLGEKWTRYQEGMSERRTPAFHVLSDGRLLAGTVAGLYMSADRGNSWKRVSPDTLTIRSIAHHPMRTDRILVGTEGAGVWASHDGGKTFVKSSEGMTNVRVGALATTPGQVLVAVNHAGPESGIYRSVDGGRTFTRESELPTVLSMAVHGARLFAATKHGLWESSAGAWRQVKEVGDTRVEQLRSDGNRLIARTSAGLLELASPEAGGLFEKVPYRHGPPRWAALAEDALWVTDHEGLYRLHPEANDTVAAPFVGGRLEPYGKGLLYWGEGGLWYRETLETPWHELLAGPVRSWPTGHPELPLVTATRDRALILEAATGEFRELDLFFPPWDVLGAAVNEQQVLLATSGYGLVRVPLGAPVPAAVETETAR
jgi:photosystem II stability/assembly factor-like uncharacterized protein